MQSLSSKIRLVGNNSRVGQWRHCLPRQPLLISSRRDTSAKFDFIRQFSKTESTAAGSRRSSFYSFFGWYSKKLETHPISTKCVSGALISSIGSVLAQVIEHRQEEQKHGNGKNKNDRPKQEPFEIDYERISRFVLLNIVYVAPVLHHWYEFVNRALPGRSFSRVLQRTFCDEFVFSPVYVPIFLGMLWKLEGNTNENIIKMMKSELPSIIVTEWVSDANAVLERFFQFYYFYQVLRLVANTSLPTCELLFERQCGYRP